MKNVRELWKEHLGISDEQLQNVVSALRVMDGYRSLDDLRKSINQKAKYFHLIQDNNPHSFIYDDMAMVLLSQGQNVLDHDSLLDFCKEERLLQRVQQTKRTHATVENLDSFLPIAIRSFIGSAADIYGTKPENALYLIDDFRNRYLQEGREWQRDIRPKIEHFLREKAKESTRLKLILDAHASIAFLAGVVFHLKSGVETQLVQKGRVGTRTWRADDGSKSEGNCFKIEEIQLAERRDVAIAISVARSTVKEVRSYLEENLPCVGKIISFEMQTGIGHTNIKGGEHAAELADKVSNEVNSVTEGDPGVVIHIFASAPNALLFYLGQHHQAMTPCIVYEFDFDRMGNKTYQPSFLIHRGDIY